MTIRFGWSFIVLVVVNLLFGSHAVFAAGNGVPNLLPFQGRLTDSAGSPIGNVATTVNFRIYPPAGGCYIYEDTQTVTPNTYGVFSVVLGVGTNSTGPGNSFAQVFNNDVAAPLSNSCAGTYAPAANDWRLLEIVVNGSPMPQMQTIASSPFSLNSQMLEGITSSGFIQVSGSVTQANMATLVGGGDASALHKHDSLYLRRDGGNTSTGNLSTSANIYATGATSSIGVGTGAPAADIDIEKTNPALRLGMGAGGTGRVDFYSSTATQRASIQSSETTNSLNFYTGSSIALQLDASQNASFAGSIAATGTVGLGRYTAAQEPALITALTGMGAGATGTMWVNSSTNILRYWDGSAAQSIASVGASVSSFNGRTGAVTPQANDYTWNQIDKTVSSLADLTTRSAADLSSGTLADARLSSNVPLKNASNTFSVGGQEIDIAAAASVGLTVKGAAAQSSNLSEWRDNGGTLLYSVEPTGNPAAATDLTHKSYVTTYVATQLGNYLKKDGSVPMTGALDFATWTTAGRPAAPVAGRTGYNSTLNQLETYNGTSWVSGSGGTVTSVGASAPITSTGGTTPTIGVTSGNLTESTSSVLTITGGASSVLGAGTSIQVKKATNAQDGYLSSADWTTFNNKQASLGYTPVNKAGDTAVGSLALSAQNTFGLGVYTNAQEATLTSGLAAADAGKTWYNSTSNQVKYWDGSAAQPLGIAGSGITSMNGLTGSTQTFATGTAGADFGISSAGTTHTFNLPTASGTARGLLSSADWTTFNNKQGALGYTPVNKTGDTMTGALNFGTWTTAGRPGAPVAGTTGYNTSLNQLETYNGTSWVSGSGGTVTSVGATAPITSTGGATPTIGVTSGNLTEATSSVLTITGGASSVLGAGTSIQVKKATNAQDGYLSSADWTTFNNKQAALGYTPVNKAGDTMTGALDMGTFDITNAGNINMAASKTLGLSTQAADPATGGWGAAQKGYTWFNTTSNQVKYWDGSAVQALGVAGSGLTSLNGQTGSTQTFSAGSSGTSPAISSAGNVHTLNVPLASTAGVTSGTISNADYSSFSGKVNKAGDTMTGALNFGTWTTAGRPGAPVAGTTGYNTSLNQLETYNGTSWVSGSGGTVTSVTASAPLASSGGATPNITVSSGNLTEATSSVLTITGGASSVLGAGTSIQVKKATNAQDGYLSSADWTTFNNKQASLGYTPVDKAGDTMTGALNFATWTTAGRPGAPVAGTTGFNTTTGQLETYDGAAWVSGTTGAVTSVGATAPITSTGGATPTIGVTSGNLSESTSSVLTITGGASSVLGAGTSIQVKKATNAQDGYLSSADWTTFNNKQAALGYTPVNKAGDTAVGSLALSAQNTFGLGVYTNAQEATLTSGLAAADAGKTWYNSTSNQVKYWDGSAAQSLGVAGSGLTSLNGLNGSTQTFATGTAGADFGISSAGTTHTFNLPTASGTARGLLSSADWTTFNNKQAALGYTPVDKAGDTMTGALNFGTWTTAGRPGAPVAGTTGYNTSLNQLETYNGTSWVSGSGGTVTSVGATAPITSTGGATPTIGVTSGNLSESTSSVLTITGGASSVLGAGTSIQVKKATNAQDGYLSSADWTTFNNKQAALGYTPVNKAGDTAVGSLALSAQNTFGLGVYTNAQEATLTSGLAAADAGKTWYNSTSNQVKYWDGSAAQPLGIAGSGITSMNGLTGSTQTFATGTAGTDFGISSAGTTHTFNLPTASGTVRGLLSSADWTTFNNKQASLGYTPVDKAGDTMTGALNFGTWTTAGRPGAPVAGTTGYNTSLNQLETYNGTSWVSGSGGTVTSVTASAPLASSGGATPNITVSSGNLTEATSSVLTITGGASSVLGAGTSIQVKKATNAQDGYLSSADWTTFNNKQASLGYTPVNTAGDTMTGALNFGTWTTAGRPGAPVAGTTGYNTTLNQLETYNGTSWASGSGGTVTSVGATAPITSTGGATPTIGVTSGNLSETTSSILTITGGSSSVLGAGTTIEVKKATGAQDGYLASADWTTFNNKQAALGYTPVNKVGDTMSGALSITLGSDSVGLTIKGNGTQTSNLSEWRNNANTLLYSVEPTGNPGATTDLTHKSYVTTYVSTQLGNYLKLDGTAAMTGALQPASWATAGRPGTPSAGMTGYNTSLNQLETYNGTSWVSGSGGTVTSVGATAPITSTGGATPTIGVTSGNLTEATSSVLTITGGSSSVLGAGTTIQVKKATNAQDGYLASADWTTFNNKQAALGYTPVNQAGDTMTGTLNLPASTTSAGTSPLKIASGTLMTAPEAGAIEYDGTNLYYTDSTNVRRTLSTGGGSSLLKTGDTMTGTLTLRAETTAAGTAPLKIQTGVLMTTPEAGAVEYDGTNLYFTDSTAARRTLNFNTLVGAGSAGIAAFNAGTATTLARSDHTHRVFYVMQWYFPGQVSAGTQTARAQVPKGVTNCTITDSQITANTTSAAASSYNILRCTAAGPACTTTANVYAAAVSLAANTESASGGVPGTATVSAGDVFKVNLASVGASLADVTVAMTYKCEDTN